MKIGKGVALLVLSAGLSATGAPPSGAQDDPREKAGAPAAKADGGPPPGRDARPPGFGPGMFLAPAIMRYADADRDGSLTADEAIAAADRLVSKAAGDSGSPIDAAALATAIAELIGGPPGGPGPAGMLAGRLIQVADSDKDGKLSVAEAKARAASFVAGPDPGKRGPLTAEALAATINANIGPPPGMGPGGPMAAERALVKQFDAGKDGRLDRAERDAARAMLKKEKAKNPGGMGFGPPPGGPGGPGGPGRDEPGRPGPHVEPSEVAQYPGRPLYDPEIIRTLFLDFEDADWESEMADFYKTDVEVPATLRVDGKVYPGVGVHFRGMSSFFAVREGSKRSLNVSLDFSEPKQRLGGYKTLNLLNAHEDPTFLHSVLYLGIARSMIPAPKANFVKVVINGESWGLYTNAQQFDKVFLVENYKSPEKGARWKVRGSPGGGGGLDYLGDTIADYRSRYEIKSGDEPANWKALVTLCKTLRETPADRLESALAPMLDVEGTLRFLALDNALINNDGYWVRASDYSIFRDGEGIFHVIPHDANETFQAAMSGMGFGPPGMGGPPDMMRRPPGGPPGGGRPGGIAGLFGTGRGGPVGVKFDLDPLVGMDDARTPLRSKLLAVPALRDRYLRHVREIAETTLDWSKFGPIVAAQRALIDREVEADTRKLTSYESFLRTTSDQPPTKGTAAGRPGPGGFGPPEVSLRAFADGRRAYLLDNRDVREAKP